MTNLVIVESPGKLESIRGYLGQGWQVEASYGHVRDLPENEMGFDEVSFKPNYVLTERGSKTVSKLKRLASLADAVYLATDLDREGESIAWHLKETLELENPLRITFSEINEKAIKQAIQSPRTINMRVVGSQELRRILDRDCGFSVSPALSKKVGIPMSAGRVQSPAVRLVVEQERAIRAFKKTEHFGAELHFESGWVAEWNTQSHLVGDAEYILDRKIAESIAKISQVKIASFEFGDSKRNPPAPFVTATLQQAASNKLGFETSYTMQLAQSLYENGLGSSGAITYMRTDCPNMSSEALGQLFNEATKLGLNMTETPRTWKSSGGAQEAHECIRPTHFEIHEAGKTDDEKALYRLIWQRAMACQIEEAIYSVRKVRLTGDIDGRLVSFDATGRVLKRKGWLTILDGDDTEEKEVSSTNPIPDLKIGDFLTPESSKVLVKRTNAPKRYTDASLIKKMVDEGIGRPSTYAAIITNIVKRKYIEVRNKQLYATANGERVYDGLVGHFSFMEYDFTRKMEMICDEVAEGKSTYKTTISQFHATLSSELENYKKATGIKPVHPCPDCGKALHRIPGKEENSYFWGCSGHPECSTTLPDLNGKPGPKKAVIKPSSHKCPDCGAGLIHRKGAAKPGKKTYDFWGCSGYPKCKSSFEDAGGKPGKASK